MIFMGFLDFLKKKNSNNNSNNAKINTEAKSEKINNDEKLIGLTNNLNDLNNLGSSLNEGLDDIPKPPKTDDYDIIHSDNDEEHLGISGMPGSQSTEPQNLQTIQEPTMPRAPGMPGAQEEPKKLMDEFGGPISGVAGTNLTNGQNPTTSPNPANTVGTNNPGNSINPINDNISGRQENKDNIANKNIDNQELRAGVEQTINQANNIEIPDFDDLELEEAEELEEANKIAPTNAPTDAISEADDQKPGLRNENIKSTGISLPAFDDVDDTEAIFISEEESLYVSAQSYEKIINTIKGLKQKSKNLEKSLKARREEELEEKETLETFTTILRETQHELLAMDSKLSR